MDRLEQKILDIIDAHAEELNAVAMDIYHHAERGYIEIETAKIATDYLKKIGLTPREGLALTGFRADIGEGDGPTVALIGELDGITCPAHPDASPSGIAHACGHEAQMAAVLGAALALSDPEVKEALGGKAAVFAVPAEEFLSSSVRAELAKQQGIRYSGGKSELIRRGEFDDIDMALTSHVHMLNNEDSDLLLGNCACTGFIGKTIIIHGRAAHAAQAPHDGINAVNAASLGFSALGMIRETFREKDCVRVHPIITEGGGAVNVVPDRVVIEMLLRALTLPAIEEVSKKVDRAYQGGAYSIGATAEIIDDQGFLPVIMRPADPVLLAAADVLKEREDLKVNTVTPDMINTASTDVGDLTHIMPVLNFTFGGTTGPLHSKDFRIVDSYKAHIMPAKMMAITAYRLLKDQAAEARATVAGFKPALSREEYLAYAEKLHER